MKKLENVIKNKETIAEQFCVAVNAGQFPHRSRGGLK